MLRSLNFPLTSSRGGRNCITCRLAHSFKPGQPSPPTTTSLLPSTRNFSSSPTSRRRGGPVKVLPSFDWRKPPGGWPTPGSVLTVDTEEEANELLESLTSKRLSIDLEPGHRSQVSRSNLRATSHTSRPNYHASSTSEGFFSVADGEGIIVMHTAKMKPQTLLKSCSTSWKTQALRSRPSAESAIAVREFLFDPDFFRNARPSNVLCLRQLASKTYPALDDPAAAKMPNLPFAGKLAEQMGMSFLVAATGEAEYHIQKLQGPLLHRLLNQAWFTHCAGLEIRNAYHKRTDKVLSTQPQLAAQRHMFAEAAEEMLEHFRYSADEVEEAFRKQGKL